MSKSTKPEPDAAPEKNEADTATPTDAPTDTSTPATSDSSGAETDPTESTRGSSETPSTDDSGDTGAGVGSGVSLSPNPDGVPSGLADETDDAPAEVQVSDEAQVDTIANPAPLDPPTTAFGSRFRAQHDGGVVKVATSGAGYVGGWALEFEYSALDELIDVLTHLRDSVGAAGSDD